MAAPWEMDWAKPEEDTLPWERNWKRTKKEEPHTGFLAGLKSGWEGLKGDVGSVGAAMGVSGAEEYSAEQRKKAAEAAQLPEFSEHPWEYVKTLAGQSIPYMVAPVVAAVAAPKAALGTVAGVALTGADLAATAASGVQFFGSNLSRQLGEGKKPGELDLGSAAAAAPFQAALDTIGLKFIPGLRKIFGEAGVKMTDEQLTDLIKKRATESLAQKVLQYGTKAVQTSAVEGFTEAGQQVLERAQAGLSIADPEARKEYFDNFTGGAALGMLFGVPGHAMERGGQERQFADLQQRQAAEAAKQQAYQAGTPTQLPLGQVPEFAPEYEGYRAAPEPYRAAEEAEGDRQNRMFQITELRDQHDRLMREVDRLKAQFETAATPEQKQGILNQAKKFNDARAEIEAQIKQLSKGMEGTERAGAEATPEQRGLDFDMPAMPRQKTGEGTVLGEAEEVPAGLTPEQKQLFKQERIKAIHARMAAGQPITLADTAFLSMMERENRVDIESRPTPDLFTGEPTATPSTTPLELPPVNEPKRPFFNLEPSNVPQPTTTPMPEVPGVETRPVTEDDFKAMGIGKTNKKLREAILGKDLADPEQRAEVHSILSDFANAPNRSEKLIQGVESFLTSPTFMEQGELDLRQPRKPRAKKTEATNGIESGEPVGTTSEPSSAVVEQRGEEPAAGTEASVSTGLGVAGEPTGQPAVGEGTQSAALTEEENAPAVPPTIQATATPAVEERAAPAPATSRVEAKDAIARLMAEGNVRRAEAVEGVNQLVDSFGTVAESDLQQAIERAKPGKQKYSMSEEAGDGMPKSEVQKIVDNIHAHWKNAPVTKVVQDIQELPQHLFQQLVRDNAWDARGVYDTTTKIVYLISDNLHSPEGVASAVIHESLGHFGIQSILGNTYTKVMEDIYNGNEKVREAAKARMEKYGEDKHTAVEEVLAHMAEKGVYNTAIQRIFNAIRQFFRRIGVNPKKVTDTEIRALLANAQRFVVAHGPVREGTASFKNKTRYSRSAAPLTQAGQEAAALNERMKGIANEPEPDINLTYRQRLGLVPSMFKGLGMKFRQSVVDKDAPVKEQLVAEFNNKLISATEGIRADVLNEQAQEAAGLADQLMRRGGLKMTKDGLWQVTDRTENGETISLDRVFEVVIETLGKKLGSAKVAVTLAHRALIAQRANELNKRNETLRQQADAAEAKGNTAAAKKLRDQIIQVRASKEEIDAGLEAMQKYPEIKQAYDIFTKYNEGIIDFLVQSGRISKAEAQEWKDNIGYVPWTRVEEEDNKLSELGKLRTGNVHLPSLPQLDKEGSNKEIRNILDNMVGNTIWAVRSGLKNRAALKTLEQMPGAVELKAQQDVDRALANKAERHLVVFAYRDGERVAFKLQNEVDLPAFSTVVDTAGPILAVFRGAATGLRGFVTHMPTFALSQLSQDTVRAMFLSGVKHPFSLPSKVMKNFAKAVTGGATEMQALGITGAFDGMPEHAMRKARERHGLQERALFRKMWDKLEDFSLAADMAVRAAIYEQTMQETGDQVLAFHRAKEYINFKTSGNGQTVRILRQVVPFMNAYIQGMDVLYRTIQGKGLSMEDRKTAIALFLTTGMKVAALSTLYAMLVADDDDYKGLDDYEQDKNFIIPGTGVKLPVAPEIGFLFKVIPERLYTAMIREGTDRPVDATTFWRGMRDSVVNAYGGVNLTPQAVKPLIEVATNHSFFTGNPIVGINMADKEVSEQFNDHTSELAKLAAYVGISPMKADHLLRGYLGTVGGVLLDVTDAVADPNRMAKPVNKLPLVSTFMYDDTGRGYKTEFYAFREDVDTVVNTVNSFKREGRAEELQNYLTEDKIKLYAMKGVVNKIEEHLGKLRQYRNIISHDPSLSSDEKREKVDEILKQEKELLKAYNVPKLKQMSGM